MHRTWWCSTCDVEREQGIESEFVHEARDATQQREHEFWSRGLFAKSALPELPLLGDLSVHVFKDETCGTLSGEVYAYGWCNEGQVVVTGVSSGRLGRG